MRYTDAPGIVTWSEVHTKHFYVKFNPLMDNLVAGYGNPNTGITNMIWD